MKIALLSSLVMILLCPMALAAQREAALLKPCEVPIIENGQQIGSVKLPVGSIVEVVSEQPDGFTVSRGGAITFKITKDCLVPGASGSTAPSTLSTGASDSTFGSYYESFKVQCSTLYEQAKKTALSNIAVVTSFLATNVPALGISTMTPEQKGAATSPATASSPSPIPQQIATIANRSSPEAASTPAVAPKVIDHFSRALSMAITASPRAMHMSDAFGLADLEKAKARAIREKKPLGFIMVWETKGDFFNYSIDTRNTYGPSALLHFYKGFNDNIVLVFVRHENQLGLVPPAVTQGFSGPDEGGFAPNMAVTDATCTEFIVEIPTRDEKGPGRDIIFADGAKKIDLWLSTHPDAVTKQH